MKLDFCGDIEEVIDGIGVLSRELKFELSRDDIVIRVEKWTEDRLEVIRNGKDVVISYKEKIHFFRGLGLFLEALQGKNEFHLSEVPQFDTNGVMFDVSQGNAVISKESVKNILRKMAVMGLNMLMLYAEDSYDVKEEPFFGYMRSRYSHNEMKELDDYAFSLGIEMIPCIQTLAHLVDVLKWGCYYEIRDDDDTLLVGEDKTYAFIERMIGSASSPFRTKRIHIGMDEAWKLGQGNYLERFGYRSKFDILNDHLEKVVEIVRKHGLKPMIWSDAYFRVASETGDYYDRKSIIPQEVINKVPQGVQLAYWDYQHQSEDAYIDLIRKHKEFGSLPVFAGGIWNWNSYAIEYDKTFATTNPALAACRKEGIREVFATIWGDGGCESNVYANLLGMQLFAEHGYAEALDTEKLKKRFRFCTGCSYEDFYRMTYLDKFPDTPTQDNWVFTNPSKYLMWQDLMAGLFDKNIEGLKLGRHYKKLEASMREASANNGEFGFLFEFLEKVCSVLAIKAEMGLKITKAYREKDAKALRSIANTELPELAFKAEDLRSCHMNIWMQVYKPLGWEVFDVRYGGVLARIRTTVARINAFLEGKVECLEELEEERMNFEGVPGLIACNFYSRTVSASRLSFSYGY